MPKAYAVVTYRSISDSRKARRLCEARAPGSHTFWGAYPCSRRCGSRREQGLTERTVVVEYPSLEKATAAHDSATYEKDLDQA
jgi:uncharacterized protein (DUF1330 family)